MNGDRPRVDPVVTELVRNGVIAITEEMKTNLTRTAYNMIIYEALDFTVGLFTAKGETVSIGLGLPMFIRGMAETVKAKLRHFGDDIGPGDILLTNDAYITGSHLNHLTFSMPIFDGGTLVGFAVCMAHWPDIGGTLDGMTTDIYSEGLQIPILKYQRAGKVNQDLLDILQMNVRLPERAMGDLRAQLTAISSGERRFLELIRRYGRDAVLDGIAEIMDQSETAARARTSRDTGRSLSGRVLHGRRRGRHRPARSHPGQGDRRRRPGNRRSFRRVGAGQGFLQLGRDHGVRLLAGRVQVPYLADRLSDQRRQLPQPGSGGADGSRRQRREAGADALVDDLPDDHRRYGVQGACARDPGPHRRRTPCRPDHRHAERSQSPDLGVLHRFHRPDRRRLGRETGGGREQRDDLHERRRHP